MELYGSNIKKLSIFAQNKAFLKFWEMELSYISRNGIFYILENGNTKKFCYF